MNWLNYETKVLKRLAGSPPLRPRRFESHLASWLRSCSSRILQKGKETGQLQIRHRHQDLTCGARDREASLEQPEEVHLGLDRDRQRDEDVVRLLHGEGRPDRLEVVAGGRERRVRVVAPHDHLPTVSRGAREEPLAAPAPLRRELSIDAGCTPALYSLKAPWKLSSSKR